MKNDNLFCLDGKVIIITGAGGLLGIRHAEAIASYGGTPILIDLHVEKIEKNTAELNKKFNVNASFLVVDITNENEVSNSADYLVEKYGKIDGLINNAANNPKVEDNKEKNFSRLENFPLDTWNQDIAVGLTGAYLCSKHYGYIISKNKLGGIIINISSDLGLIAPDQRLYKKPGLEESQQSVKPVTYSVVKSGLIGLTRYISTYWADHNVRCNAMCPGGIENGQTDAFIKDVCYRIPLNRLANPQDYQSTLIWMLSDTSSYLNGAIISIDGGRTAW
jgi:NAD(P)-dependent dehydrogenase (short-subunit alcohol dehydrogenase family)